MKTYRVYFNRAEDGPQVWSVDEGSHESEINVRNVLIKATAVSAYDQKAQYPEPKAWLIVCGTLDIDAGTAVINA